MSLFITKFSKKMHDVDISNAVMLYNLNLAIFRCS